MRRTEASRRWPKRLAANLSTSTSEESNLCCQKEHLSPSFPPQPAAISPVPLNQQKQHSFASTSAALSAAPRWKMPFLALLAAVIFGLSFLTDFKFPSVSGSPQLDYWQQPSQNYDVPSISGDRGPYYDYNPHDQYGDDTTQYVWYESNDAHKHQYRFTQRHPSEFTEWAKITPPLIDTGFSCDLVVVPGYYADMESHCQMFHVCTESKRKFSFFCPEGTFFNQKYLVCDWSGGNTCMLSPYYYTSHSEHWYKALIGRRR